MPENQKKILLIEDDEDLRELYRTILIEAGFLLDEAADGKEGISKVTSPEKYDLVLLDIMLPKFDGLEVLRTMKRSRDLANVPVIMLTNLGQDSIIKEAFSLGADGYLIKSEYDPGQLLQEVQTFLSK
ncbi:response regulator [candidate division WWE3 bacterium CG08_land_8_20_14_0_20_43_13]|uniref:Response regulator n=1 Tax=candidate division WWE3 bacterium CG08_land_8_20_14_0_20_43_13 TaxID=1975087 RepID=A0A2H0X720_UNCKA|nr:MAG: response regulator [candidate division WWE3 bacterium CG08_land_8_20_14_0_20_43_13]